MEPTMYASDYARYASDYAREYSDVVGLTAAGVVVGNIISTILIISAVFYVLLVISQWKIFTKAGQKGWKSIIPIYNTVIMYRIVGLSPWLLLLLFIPFVNIIAAPVLVIMQAIKLAKCFGKGAGYAVGIIFLMPIFQMILGFGSAEYVGPDNS